MGAGAAATIIGELARTTGVKTRTAVLSVFIGVRQIGLVIGKSSDWELTVHTLPVWLVGPAFNLFLGKCNFNVGPFEANSLTAPGVSERNLNNIISL